jgi:hypothetical protein
LKNRIFPWGIGSSSFWLAKLYMNKLPILSCRSAITLETVAPLLQAYPDCDYCNILVIVHGEVWSFFLGV